MNKRINIIRKYLKEGNPIFFISPRDINGNFIDTVCLWSKRDSLVVENSNGFREYFTKLPINMQEDIMLELETIISK